MKKTYLLFLIFAFSGLSSAQNFNLKIIGSTDIETNRIDSIGYLTIHKNAKSILEESNILNETLLRIGFIESQLLEKSKPNDSTFLFKLNIGKKTKSIHIYISKKYSDIIAENYSIKNDTLQLPIESAEGFLNTTLKKLEVNGFSMAKVQLTNIQKLNTKLIADLVITKEIKRTVNDIVINGYEKFPESHKKNILRLYRNKIFNQKNLEKLYLDFEKFRFVKQSRYPEILFTKEATKIYVYLDKTKPNTFDGFVGFTNNETKKVIFSGYLDLALNNILNSGEKLNFYWKSDGQNQKTFNLSVELPYIFKSPLGVKAEINIFKQDSTFQNAKTAFNLGYYFNYNTRLYIGYQSTESSDIQNINSTNLSDFNNSFTTTSFEFIDFKIDDFLFPEKTKLDIKFGIGSRQSKQSSDEQLLGSLNFHHNIYLNQKNIINLKSHNFYLQSNSYIVNELYRFGGINSFRGFNENSLQGNFFSSLLSEYRYILAPNLYVHTIIDYGYTQDKTAQSNNNLLGLGLGFGLLSKNGLFNFVYANGNNNNQTNKATNSIIHISFKAVF